MAEESRFNTYRKRVKNFLTFKNFNNLPNFIEILEKGLEKELSFSASKSDTPIPVEELPIDLSLRKSGIIRKVYEKIFPVTHVFQISYKFNGVFMENFMPITNDDFIGRGGYKFVYKLPWNQVVKVGKSKLGSDPLFGSLFKEVSKNLEMYLKPEEMELKNYLQSK